MLSEVKDVAETSSEQSERAFIIAIDVNGADNSPDALVLGAVEALTRETGFSVALFGDETEIKSVLSRTKYEQSRVEIYHTTEIIKNTDVPTQAVLNKKDSSLVRALNFLSENPAAAGLVSAGSTGAVLTGALVLLKRIRGVNRPGFAPLLPSAQGDGQVLLIDSGANTEPKPSHLLQFALMGGALVKSLLGIENPKVGLLSNGTEDTKGNAVNKEAFPLLKGAAINFVGNIEARDLISGAVDVVVCDGYSGNIALKACEGTALGMFEIIKRGIMKGGLRAKLGYLLFKPVFKGVKKKLDYNDSSGGMLLGMEKIVIKSHGSSKKEAIANSVLQAKRLAELDLAAKIADAMPL
jgi:glycerol-3-phosphate acyltransferase PlsX